VVFLNGEEYPLLLIHFTTFGPLVQTQLLVSESVSGEGLSFGNREATCAFDASGFL
jgi:hypothetical protein